MVPFLGPILSLRAELPALFSSGFSLSCLSRPSITSFPFFYSLHALGVSGLLLCQEFTSSTNSLRNSWALQHPGTRAGLPIDPVWLITPLIRADTRDAQRIFQRVLCAGMFAKEKAEKVEADLALIFSERMSNPGFTWLEFQSHVS